MYLCFRCRNRHLKIVGRGQSKKKNIKSNQNTQQITVIVLSVINDYSLLNGLIFQHKF